MFELKPDFDLSKGTQVPLTFHPSFYSICEKLKQWTVRFPHFIDESAFTELFQFYLQATKKFLDHRNITHLTRLILSIYWMHKKILKSATFSSHIRHLEIRWLPTSLCFPFSSKPVLGCLIGFNNMNRYELFDEENILLTLQKHFPDVMLVNESSYCHPSSLKIFYLEVEKKDGLSFSFMEQTVLKRFLEQKVKNSIQPISRTVFKGLNDEEVYKNIINLSREIQSLHDIPQVYMTFERHVDDEIVFCVILVSSCERYSLKEHFFNCRITLQNTFTVKHIDGYPIEAHVFYLYLPQSASLLRLNGSLNFYAARQSVVALLKKNIGDFRDYNGGTFAKQEEMLQYLKKYFPDDSDHELLEAFFYAIQPLEKQTVLPVETLSKLFAYFLENRCQIASVPYLFKTYVHSHQTFLIIQGKDSLLNEILSTITQEVSFKAQEMAYNLINNADGVFFNCVFLETYENTTALIQRIQHSLECWHQRLHDKQTLKIGMEYPLMSLDPRISGGESANCVLKLLFEGLTRFNQNNQIENAIAESIKISSDLKEYIFTLRHSLWNHGSMVTAFDFEYAWKKVLSPDFETSSAYLFFPIKNAKEAKEGLVSIDEIGVQAVDERTLVVQLDHPTPYFLQLTAHPLYSPVDLAVDQQYPQWPYQCEKQYPCNGPFQLKINQPNQGYELIKNPNYWEKEQIILDQITLRLMNPIEAMAAFKNDQILAFHKNFSL